MSPAGAAFFKKIGQGHQDHQEPVIQCWRWSSPTSVWDWISQRACGAFWQLNLVAMAGSWSVLLAWSLLALFLTQHFVSLTHELATAYQCLRPRIPLNLYLSIVAVIDCRWKTHECTLHWLDYLILFMLLTENFCRLWPRLISSSLPLELIQH